MEVPIRSEPENNERKLRRYISALKTLEDKYQRGEVELNSVVYAVNELQNVFFSELQARGIIKVDTNYRELYRADVTDDGYHYTKILPTKTEVTDKTKTPEQKVIDLVSKIGPILSVEVVQSALDKARDPKISEETLDKLLNNLLSQAIAKLNNL